jgi:predicted nuclease of predicted toxin-antitoxin system
MLPLAADESLHGHIIRGLRRRLPDIDLVVVQECGLAGTPDPEILEWTAQEGRVLIAQDKRTMADYAYDRLNAGLPMPGVVIRPGRVSIGQSIDELLLIAQCGTLEDFRDQVRYLPL